MKEKSGNIVSGVTQLAIALNLSPEQAAAMYVNMNTNTANGIAYMLSPGQGDGHIIKEVGKKLEQTGDKK